MFKPDKKSTLTKTKWLIAFVLLALCSLAFLRIFLSTEPPKDTLLYTITTGFVGNIISGIWVSVLFLFVTMHLGSDTESKLHRISEIVDEQKEQIETTRKISQFDEFMQKESYHNVRFPKLRSTADSLGLEYTIEPQRNPDGTPLRLANEMESLYVIRVRGPAHEDVLSPERLMEYESSPIKDGEFYFCRYYNDSWHMSQGTFPSDSQPFYLSSKVGPIQHGQTANQYMGLLADPPNHALICRMLILQDGTEYSGSGNYITEHKIFQNTAGKLFLKIYDSPLKAIYLLHPENAENRSDTVLAIEGLRGYWEGEALVNLKNTIQTKLERLAITIPRVEWYDLP